MLTFESPFHEVEGVVVFRDHADPHTFHYLAGPPRLTRDDGRPSFLLLEYKNALDAAGDVTPEEREKLGGGFVMFGVDCGLGDKLQDIQRELENRTGGPVTLVPVLYTKGTVNLVALDAQRGAVDADAAADPEKSRFVRGIIGTATPSLLQDQRAIFSLSLPPDGVVLLRDAYESELSPIGVMYELEFSGLRPALQVKAKVDKKRVYEHFKAGLKIGFHSGGGGTTGTGTGTAATGTAGTGTAGTGTAGTGTAGTGTAGTGTAGTGTAGTGTAGTGTAGTGTGTTGGQPHPAGHAPAASPGGGLALDADLSLAIQDLKESGAIKIEIVRQQEGQSVDAMEQAALQLLKESLLEEFFQPGMTGADPAASASTALGQANQLMAASNSFNQGQAGTASKVSIGLQLQYKHEEELREATYDYSVAAPEKRTHAPNGFFSALLTGTQREQLIRKVDLDDPFFKTVDVEITTTADFDGLDLEVIQVDVQYGGTVEQPAQTASHVFSKDDSAAKHFQAFLIGRDVSWRYRVAYKFGQSTEVAGAHPEYTTPWRTSTGRALVIHPPDDVPLLQVAVAPGVIDWELVEAVETSLSYEDPSIPLSTSRTFIIRSGETAKNWVVRLTEAARRTYSVRHLWHLKDSSQIQGGPSEPVSEAQLHVPDPFTDRLDLQVQAAVDRTTVSRVDVQIRYEDATNHVSLQRTVQIAGPDFLPQKVTIPRMPGGVREYSYQAMVVKVNGSVETQPAVTTDRLSIVVTEGGTYFDVTVTLLGDLAAAQLDAVQVDLRSEPLDGAHQRVESKLFQPGAETQAVIRIMLRSDRPERFEYRTVAFAKDGRQVEGAWTAHTTESLAISATRLLTPTP